MRSPFLSTVLRIQLTGLPRSFDARELESEGCLMQQDIESMINARSILLHTQLAHKFSLEVDEKSRASIHLLVGMVPKNQLVLDYSTSQLPTNSLGDLEQLVLQDRQRLVSACQNLATHTTLTVNKFAQRVSAACLQLPVAQLELELRHSLQSMLDLKARTWRGRLVDQPWQHDVPAIPKYDWLKEIFNVRAMLHRERRGYSLTLLRRASLAEPLLTSRKLVMPERPIDLKSTAELERAEFTRKPVDILIRVGTLAGYDKVVIADFIKFVCDT